MKTVARRPFGSTGETVPMLSGGAAPFKLENADANIAAARRAVELGVNYFDTAPMYGDGQSQQVLGRALAEISEPVFVATKVGHFRDRTHYRDVDAITAQLHGNLRSLGRDHVDLLQIHEAEWIGWWRDDDSTDALIDPEEVLDFADAPIVQVLHRARDEGLCRFIGMTSNTTAPLAYLLTKLDVDAVLSAYTYNLMQRGVVKYLLPVARERGVALISAGPLYCGRIAAPNRDWLENPPDWMPSEIHARYGDLCDLPDETGIPMAELAIRYVIGDPDLDTVLNGYRSVDEIEQNVAAVSAGPLPDDICERIDSISLDSPDIHPWLPDFWKLMGKRAESGG